MGGELSCSYPGEKAIKDRFLKIRFKIIVANINTAFLKGIVKHWSIKAGKDKIQKKMEQKIILTAGVFQND